MRVLARQAVVVVAASVFFGIVLATVWALGPFLVAAEVGR